MTDTKSDNPLFLIEPNVLMFLLIFFRLENFCTDGVELLKSLIQSRYLRAAVHLLDNILPPTYPLSFYLLNNSQ